LTTAYTYAQIYLYQGILFSSDELFTKGKRRRLEDLDTKGLDILFVRANRLITVFATLASKQSWYCQDIHLSPDQTRPTVIAMAIIWCTRHALSIKPSWTPALSQLSGLQASECFTAFKQLYRAYEPQVDEVKLRLQLPDQKPIHYLEVPIDINRSSSHLCGNSTTCGSGENSEESSLPLQENTHETSLLINESNDRKTPNLYRKAEKIPVTLIKSSSQLIVPLRSTQTTINSPKAGKLRIKVTI